MALSSVSKLCCEGKVPLHHQETMKLTSDVIVLILQMDMKSVGSFYYENFVSEVALLPAGLQAMLALSC